MTSIEQIVKAFGVRPPPAEPIVEEEYLNPESQGDEGATEYFSGKSWKGLAAASLVWHRAAMYMFTPVAHQYYLPAFMVAAIEHPKEADEIPDLIIWHFADYEEPFWWKRICMLTAEQCDVVAAFINAVADKYHREEGYVERAFRGLDHAKQRANKRFERDSRC